MKSCIHFAIILFLVLCFGFSTLKLANGQGKKPPPEKNHVAHEILVKFHPWVDESEKQAVRNSLEAVKVKVVKSIQVEYWQLPEELSTEKALDFLRETSSVESAEPNYLYKPQSIPNDPHFNHLWYLDNHGQTVNGTTGIPGADIHAAQAWDIETGSQDIVIAVIDSGVAFDHPDLQNNVWINQDEISDNGIDDDHNGYVDDRHGWDFVNDDNNPSDYSRDLYSDGHGTHVAGIIAAEGNNNLGVCGVMWHAQIMPLQIFDLYEKSSYFDNLIQLINILDAIEYAANNGAKIINCSFGSPAYSQFQYDIIAYANQHGALVVCAAGNDSMDTDENPHYPSSYNLPNIISVAAADESDELSSYSNYGLESVDVAAPGGSGIGNIYSTIPPERITLFHDDFESTNNKWLTNGIYENWSVGYDFYWSSYLQDSVGDYHTDENSKVWTKDAINATNCRGLFFEYDLYYSLETDYDFVYTEISWDGNNYNPIHEHTGFSGGWKTQLLWYNEMNLDSFYLRFRLVTDYLFNYDGIMLDDITITGIPWVFSGNEYDYKSGTSMAAPVLSGLAGLIWSLNSDLSHLEVKNVILNTVNKLPSLDGKVLAGGRVNACKALQLVDGGGSCGLPIADFAATPTSKTLPFSCNCTDLSTGIPNSWFWDFGDGETSTDKNPQHIYTDDGWHTVSLTVSNMYGSDTETKIDYIDVAPCTNKAVKIGALYFDSLQGAYDQCFDGKTIQVQALIFSEQLILDHDVTATLSGGFDCWYTSNPMSSTIDGKLIIEKGTAIIDRLIIQ